MAKIVEVSPLPQVCQECKEIVECRGNTGQACWECDYAEERFYLVDEEGNKILD
jgi:hypothetical protein